MAASDQEDSPSRSATPDESGGEEEVIDMPDQKENDKKPTNASTANGKDPNRPRRKKARRACFACQRAHLTCGMWMPGLI